MDVLSLVGIILAFVAIVGGNFLEGGLAGALLNGPAALIVIGGTLAGTILTLVFLPAMYSIWFKIRPDNHSAAPAPLPA